MSLAEAAIFEYAFKFGGAYDVSSRDEEKGKNGIRARKADGKQPSAFKIWVAEDKEKEFFETKEIIAWKQQSKVRN